MKYLVVGLALLLNSFARATPRENFIQELLACKNLDGIKAVHSKYIFLPPESFSNRPFDFGYTYAVWECEFIDGNYFVDFRLTLILEEDSIVYGEIGQKKKNRYWVVQGYFPMHQQRIQNLLAQYNSFYDTNYRLPEFIKELMHDFYYSLGCGETGSDLPLQAKQMLRWVETGNLRKLVEWVKSPNFELQAYAVEGLIRIRKKGIQLDKKVLEMIDHLKKRNSIILHCSGCIYGLQTPLNNLIL